MRLLAYEHRIKYGVLLAVLNIYDLFITRYAIEHNGAVEQNPLMKTAVHTWWGLAIKALLPLVVTIIALNAPPERLRVTAGLLILSVFYVTVCVWNTILL